MEPSSLARSRPKESIKSSHGLGWNDKVNSTTFQSAFGTMKQESWIGAMMGRNELVHKSKSKVDGCVGIYRTRLVCSLHIKAYQEFKIPRRRIARSST